MSARILTNEEYAKLAAKTLGRDLTVEGSGAAQWAANQMKQVHRLLCEGRKPEDLTPVEQLYAGAFKGATCVQIRNDYGWEPGVGADVAEPDSETMKTAPPPKPKKNGK